MAQLGPAFASFPRRFRPCFLQDRTAAHLDSSCRGLLAGLPRKSVGPIALASGTAVRTPQEFLTTAGGDHDLARDLLPPHPAEVIQALPADPLGTVGVIDETSCSKQGDKTPGVQRQYLGRLGKIDSGIVTAHVGVARGPFQAPLDADLYLPKSWDQDRPRCRRAGIPDSVRYRAKWRMAFDQPLRLDANGVKFDWLAFDEDYGGKVPLLRLLGPAGQRFVAEVPVNFSARLGGGSPPRRADRVRRAAGARAGRRFRIRRPAHQGQGWRAASAPVVGAGRGHVLVVAINEATAEVKYCVSNAVGQPLGRLLAAASRRATVEHSLRVAKSEGGLMPYEGRQYAGLVRHLLLALIVPGFVSVQTDRLRGEKPAGDGGASLPGVERPLRGAAAPPARDIRGQSRRLRDPLPPTPQRAGDPLPQETAA